MFKSFHIHNISILKVYTKGLCVLTIELLNVLILVMTCQQHISAFDL